MTNSRSSVIADVYRNHVKPHHYEPMLNNDIYSINKSTLEIVNCERALRWDVNKYVLKHD